MEKYPKLEKDMDIDVLIIGGGITGISTLYQLDKSSYEVMLVEQNRIGMGVTSGTTGKLNYLQDAIYDKIIQNVGEDQASLYLKSQLEAISLAEEIIKSEKIDCDLKKVPAYLYTDQEKEVSLLKKLKVFFEKNGIDVLEVTSELVESKYMIGVENTYLYHPLKFLKGLLKGIRCKNIYEGTSIQKIEKEEGFYCCYTDDGRKIRAKFVVIASHYPYFNLPFLFPLKGSLEKSYLSASLYKEDDISLISYSKPVISMRSYKDYLIYLSNSRNLSSKVKDQEHFEELERKVHDLGLVPSYVWSNIDIMTNDGLPYIGEIGDHLLMGTGYNTWGMTNGILAGKILGDLILDRDNPYVSLFSPKRKNLGYVLQGVVDGVLEADGFIKGYFFDHDRVRYEKREGKEVGIVTDDKGEHIVYVKCPHLGCRLIFNEVENTWDCPCHGSRFDLDGKCISGPANRSIRYEK